jgi:hypothetical protein
MIARSQNQIASVHELVERFASIGGGVQDFHAIKLLKFAVS